MRNILNYQTVQDFTSANDNNIPPLTWWCDESKDPDSFRYIALETPPLDSLALQLEYRGQVGEIIPGVAYIKESGATLYNSAFPLMEFNDSSKYYQTYPWSEFGITQELFDKYLDAANNRLYPKAFNISIDNTPVYEISYYRGNLSFWCGKYILVIRSDGTAYIRSSAA